MAGIKLVIGAARRHLCWFCKTTIEMNTSYFVFIKQKANPRYTPHMLQEKGYPKCCCYSCYPKQSKIFVPNRFNHEEPDLSDTREEGFISATAREYEIPIHIVSKYYHRHGNTKTFYMRLDAILIHRKMVEDGDWEEVDESE